MVTTASGSLNLRTEPSLSGGVVARIPQYATVNVQQRGDSWCYVVYNDTIGYVMTTYLTFSGDSAQTQPDGGDASGESGSGSGDNSGNTGNAGDNSGGTMTAYVQTASGSLNLREQPGSAYRVLRTIPRGSAVTVLSYGDPWCQVTYGGTEGYVMTSFLRFDTQPTLPQEPDMGEDQDETDKPETGGSSAETSQPATPTPAPPQEQPDESTAVTAWVNTASGSLNLRYSPDSSAQIIGTIPRLAAVKLLVEGNEWSYVGYNGQYGYVMTRYLTTTQPSGNGGGGSSSSGSGGQTGGSSSSGGTSQPSGGSEGQQIPDGMAENGGIILDITLQVPNSATYATAAPQSGDALRLWTMCAESGDPLASVPSGGQVEIILTGRTWCLVQYGTVQGYCRTADLEVLP